MKETLASRNNQDTFLYAGKRKEIWQVLREEIVPFNHKELIPQGIAVYLMKDHDGAGKVWDLAYEQEVIDQATLIHIDAHDDLALKLPLPTSFEQLQQEEFQVGSFIAPRIELGIIGEMFWIIPDGMKDAHSRRSSVKITKKVPQIRAELIDIDLDYFTYRLPEAFPNFLLKRRAMRFLRQLFQSIERPRIITVATSPGFIQSGRERPLLEAVIETTTEFVAGQ